MSELRYGAYILVHRTHNGRIAELVLNRPERMNAVSTDFGAALADATADLGHDPSVGVTVITSRCERAFCVGADLKERAGWTEADRAAARPGSRAAYAGVLALPMPVIAAVQGYALGGGYEIALSCDVIVADPGATVGLPETTVGVIPGGGGTQLLPRRVGAAVAAQLIFSGRRVPATEARDLGLVDVLAPAGAVRATALDLARTYAANSPVALRAAKRALRLGQGRDLAAGLEAEDAAWHTAAFSADWAEGVAAFNGRRPPDWPGYRAADRNGNRPAVANTPP
ncbi:enoyl-CoA hydratase/isomerase family protein [Streptomyces sp. NPDC059209]|uniref:enoyl-CoA hydratase/isomerase family protein n=1 Tax=Streptomyces sp. NPDC059209 TaxID=3346769 RepID=UPI003697FC18